VSAERRPRVNEEGLAVKGEWLGRPYEHQIINLYRIFDLPGWMR